MHSTLGTSPGRAPPRRTRTASTRPLTPARTLPHGRIQRTDGPSFRDLRLRGRLSAPLSQLLTQIAAASTATPALKSTWGLPTALLADLVGVWFDACVQQMRDRHGTHSTPAVQLMDTSASAVSQTPGLGSGGGDASRARAHSLQLVPLRHQGRRAAHTMAFDGTSLPVAELRHIPHSAVDWLPEPSEVHHTRRATAHSAHSVLVPEQIRPAAYHLRPDSTSTLAVQLMDTPESAVSQTPGLGSGGGDASQ